VAPAINVMMDVPIDSYEKASMSEKDLAAYLNRTGPLQTENAIVYCTLDGARVIKIDLSDLRLAKDVEVPAS